MIRNDCFGLFLLLVWPGMAQAGPLEAIVQKAGNASTDEARLQVLDELLELPNLADQYRQEGESLRTEISRYLTDEQLTYFNRTVYKSNDYDFGVAPDSPLFPLTHLYRARMLIWVTLEYGGIWSEAKARRERLDMVRQVFQAAHDAFPDEPLARMYLGEPIRPTRRFPKVSAAPSWAVAQREGLERLADIIHWWIDHRLQQNGHYGGGWGDDCEMWRWWIPLVIAFEDPKIVAAQERFSTALFDQPHMQGGYTNRLYDVEHTGEDSADTITPMLHLQANSQVWQQRALRLAEFMKNRWTGVNNLGELQFKSTYFSADKVDPSPSRACDTVYHTRAVQPALLLWQRTHDPQLTELFGTWLSTWVRAAASAERGKPAGVLPSAIHWPDGRIGGVGENWWDPENHSEDPLYVFPSAMGQMTHTLLLAYHVTRDERFLTPIRSMAALRLQYRPGDSNPDSQPGSAQWCAAKMGNLSSVLSKYRLLTGSQEFDELLRDDAAPYVRYRFWNETQQLSQALANTAAALSTNFVGYTSEVRYTDRVLALPWLFGENGIHPEAVEGMHRPDVTLLYATVSGDPGRADYFPMNAVKWLTGPRDLAVLVTDSGRDRFQAKLFHFGDQPRNMGADFYLLDRGTYVAHLGSQQRALEVTGPQTRIEFSVPPGVVFDVQLTSRSGN